MKRCGYCNQTKSEPSFNRSTKNPDGLHAWCRACQRQFYSSNDHKRRELMQDGIKTKKIQNLLLRGW